MGAGPTSSSTTRALDQGVASRRGRSEAGRPELCPSTAVGGACEVRDGRSRKRAWAVKGASGGSEGAVRGARRARESAWVE